MNRALVLLILLIIVLSWNFIFTGKKLGLTDQAWVLQGLSTATDYKTAVRRYWEQKGTLPLYEDWVRENVEVNVDISQTIVKSIEVGKDGPGVISVLYTTRPGLESPAQIDGRKINLIPGTDNGTLVWTCMGTFDVSLLPKNCSMMAGNQ